MFTLVCPHCEEEVHEKIIDDGDVYHHTLDRFEYTVECNHCKENFNIVYGISYVNSKY